MAAPWTANRLLVLLGTALTIASMLVFTGGDPGKFIEFVPAFPGMIAGLALAFVAPAWLYLTAGILLSILPLMVLFVFGAIFGLASPAGGPEYQALLLLLLSLVVSLTGGVLGFRETRAGAGRPARETLRTPQGLTLAIGAALIAGMFITSGLATAQLRAAVAGGGASNIVADETITLVMKDFAFAPTEVVVPAGKIVALVVVNEDPAAHTFTYHAGSEVIDAFVPGGGETRVLLRFTEPQTIHFWCAPHSGGAEDDGSGMVGTLVVQ